ncbi:MAG: Gfo/Idh/MocA family oxidoreductase [Bacteroidales bacterium]|nr:Gfo/Idh/MocA family oxidoreductase [Bacteroidales bacterium]
MKKNCVLLSFMVMLFGGIVLSGCDCPTKPEEKSFEPKAMFAVPERAPGQTDVIELRCEPLDTVRVAIIGLGMRGSDAVRRLSFIEGTTITVLCDVVPENVEYAQQLLTEKGKPAAAGYTGEEDWKLICEREDVDLVYVCTHWDLHTPIAVYAMEHGKHVAVEVPAALTIDECWQLVNTAEKTRRHCMMLENCNYDFFEMATLNMAQQGLFGEIVHVEGAYIHDLRWLNFDDSTGYWNMWRLKHNEKYDGNLYPTHGLGPVAHILNIHRGDKMDFLVSVSTNQFGMTAYAREQFGDTSDYAKREYKKGDMNTMIIKTNKGKTMMIQHDVTSPRPYSRIHMVSGTKGFAQKWPRRGIALEPNGHAFLPEEEMNALLAKYEHPIVTEVGQKAKEVGGHGGMDFIMDYRLIYCLRNGLPLDQDVYDAAEWSAVIELSRTSVSNNGMPVQVPDFTRGAWEKVKTVTYFTK